MCAAGIKERYKTAYWVLILAGFFVLSRLGHTFMKKSNMKKSILLLLIFISFLAKAQVFDSTYFAVNSYLQFKCGSIYPTVKASALAAIDTSLMVNVDDYGAVGDGVTVDNDAIEDAFNAAAYGVIFTTGKTYIVNDELVIPVTHNMYVWAYGATIKMQDLSRYTCLALQSTPGSYLYSIIWQGGTFDGNQYNQTWPGNPHGGVYDGPYVEAHGILLALEYSQMAFVKGVTVINPVIDGVSIRGCRIAVTTDCTASGGAPINFGLDDEQGTYFKVRGTGGVKAKWAYFNNITCTGGSIGIHYSTPSQVDPLDDSDSSTAVVNNCRFYNQRQDNMHFEDCKKVFVYKCSLSRDTAYSYRGDLQMSASTQIASIRNTNLRNGKLDFRTASDLILGMVTQCNFTSEFSNGTPDTALLITLVQGPKTTIANCNFTGRTFDEQVQCEWVKKCTFTNFHALATRGAALVDSCTFTNGVRPANLGTGGRFVDNIMTSVSNPNTNVPHIPADELPFTSTIKIFTTAGVYKGIIRCQ